MYLNIIIVRNYKDILGWIVLATCAFTGCGVNKLVEPMVKFSLVDIEVRLVCFESN